MCMRVTEDFDTFIYKQVSIDGKHFDDTYLRKHMDALCEGDTMQVILQVSSIVAGIFCIPDEFEELKTEIQKCEEDSIEIEIHIQKSAKCGYLAIYSLDSFVESLHKTTIPNLISRFCRMNEEYGAVRFWVFDREILIETETLLFTNDKNELNKKMGLSKVKRDSILSNVCEVSYVKDNALGNLTPLDFRIVKSSGGDDVCDILNQMALVYCIAYIANNSEIKEYAIGYRLVGYKVIEGEYSVLNLKDISGMLDILFKVVEWIYAEEYNFVNKCELARNILSLNIKGEWTEIGRECYLAIVSSYRVYLKTSIDNYLQIKNGVIDKIVDINDKLIETTKEYTKHLKNNLIALCSFFVTTLIVNTIAAGKIENIFTKDIRVLSYAFLLISIGYMILNNYELKENKKELEKRYESSKLLYKDVLSDEDIENIYCNDKTYENTVEMVDAAMKKYTKFWVAANVIMFIAIWVLRV